MAKTRLSLEPALRCNDRNVNSNILRVFLRRLEIQMKTGSDMFENAIKKNNFQFTVEEFMDWYERNKVNHKNYIRLSTAKKLFSLRSYHADYSAMMRTLLNHFLNNQAPLCYLTSRKAGKEDPRNNFKAFRSLVYQLVEL